MFKSLEAARAATDSSVIYTVIVDSVARRFTDNRELAGVFMTRLRTRYEGPVARSRFHIGIGYLAA